MQHHVHRALKALGTHKDRGAIFGSAALACVALAGVILLSGPPQGVPVVPVIPAPTLADFVPVGGTVASAAVTIPNLPQPDYVFVYGMNGKAYALRVAWDRDVSRYAAAGSVELPVPLVGVPQLSVVHPGSGMTWVETHMQGPATGELVLWLRTTLAAPAVVQVRDIGGESGAIPATFVRGASAMHADDVEVRDVAGDGTAGVVATATELTDGGSHTTVRAFVWDGAALAYDAAASETLTASKALFRD